MKSSNVIKRITLIKDLRKGFQSAFNLHFTKPEAKRKKEAKKREVLLVSFSNFAHFVFAIILKRISLVLNFNFFDVLAQECFDA